MIVETKVKKDFQTIKNILNNKLFLRAYLPIIIIAVLLRLLFITNRPPHHDEGVNGWWVIQMWQTGFFRYTPNNYHGPIYFYLLQLSELIFGKGVFSLRFITALISIANVILVLKHYKFFGRIAIWAGFLMAISPAMVFYGKYAIHESLLIFFIILFNYGFFLNHFRFNEKLGIILMVAGLFGAFLTKETFFIYYGCWFISISAAFVLSKIFPTKTLLTESQISGDGKKEKYLLFTLISIIIGFAVTVCFYTGFFMNLQGFKDMFSSYLAWFDTGVKSGGSGHEKPFDYWFDLILRYEWPVLLSMAAAIPLFFIKSKYCRFWILYGIGLLIGFSIIPYKTPWIIMGVIWPLYFVFGYAVEFAVKSISRKNNSASAGFLKLLSGATITCALILICHNLYKTIDLNFYKYADIYKQPYLYTHTDISINHFMENIFKLQKIKPEAKNIQIYVHIRETWPLPWLLGDWPNTSYYPFNKNAKPIKGDVFLVDAADAKDFESKLSEKYLLVKGKLRDAYTDINFYYKYSLFKDILENNEDKAFQIYWPD